MLFVPDSSYYWKDCNVVLKKEEVDFPSDFDDDVLSSQDDFSARCSSAGSKMTNPEEKKYWTPDAAKYKCSKCSKSFRWKHHLIHHLKVSCGGVKSECCPFCDYRTDRKWNLKSHVKRRHNIQQ